MWSPSHIFQSPFRIYYILRFGNPQLCKPLCAKKMHPGRGAKNPKGISSLAGFLRWRQCMALLLKRGGQYLRWSVLLAYHLKAPSKVTNPEEWACLTQEMEVWFRWCSLINWVILRFHLNFAGFLWVRCFFIDESGEFYGMPLPFRFPVGSYPELKTLNMSVSTSWRSIDHVCAEAGNIS